MGQRLPLYGQLLLWLAANLLLLAALFAALPGRTGPGWQMLLTEPVRDQLLGLGERLVAELGSTPEPQWPAVLARYSRDYKAEVRLREVTGGGPPRQTGPDGPPPDAPPGPPPERHSHQGPPAPPPPGESGSAPFKPRNGGSRQSLAQLISLHASPEGAGYVLRIPSHLGGSRPRPLDVELHSHSLAGLLGLLGMAEWFAFLALALLLSALLWWPFVWGISRTLRRLSLATQQLAEGRFGTRVATRRGDELGALAAAVNRMAERLQGQASAQRQFVADVAHEVTSPLARLRIGLGLLEAQLPATAADRFRDVHDDAEQMAALLDELLLFSRTGLQAAEEPLAACNLHQLVAAVLGREDPAQAVQNAVPQALSLNTRSAPLQRAVANLVRNALRYGSAVQVGASTSGSELLLTVADRGPGVPDAVLPRLGEPFYRPELARSRDTGGTGLGLAIVRRCVERCDGRLTLRNREGGGFEAVIALPL